MTFSNNTLRYTLLLVLLQGLAGCKEEVLNEQPLSFLSPSITLTNKAGFDAAITALHAGNRDLMLNQDDVST